MRKEVKFYETFLKDKVFIYRVYNRHMPKLSPWDMFLYGNT